MGFTPEQIKGRIKSVAKQNNADARTLMRIYMMERFLERLAQSEYRDNFIIKGGILVTAMIGVAHRSTMDIDTSMKNLNLSAEDALRVVNQVKDIDLDDGVSFDVKDVSNIMDEMEYPGIRVTMNANVGRLITPLKIDISTGDVITPRAIEFNYDLLLEDRSISLWSYNLETILAEKLQTVLARGILNTRMRDFYDIRMLLDTYEDKVNKAVLKDAFAATCKKRGTDNLQEQAEEIIKIIEADEQLQVLWRAYRKKYSYTGQNYLKSLFALAFQAFLIMVCVGIYSVLVQSIATDGNISGAIWACMGYTVLLCFALFKTGSLSKSLFGAH